MFLCDILAQACDEFLKREWRAANGEQAKGAVHNALIQDLLKYVTKYLHCDDHPVLILSESFLQY